MDCRILGTREGQGSRWEAAVENFFSENRYRQYRWRLDPDFQDVEFERQVYDLYATPPWVDSALTLMEQLLRTQMELEVVSKQRDLLAHELRITTQRVNLFEKVKIPETVADIRKIRIYLGDQQTAQVVRGKIAKRKVEGAER